MEAAGSCIYRTMRIHISEDRNVDMKRIFQLQQKKNKYVTKNFQSIISKQFWMAESLSMKNLSPRFKRYYKWINEDNAIKEVLTSHFCVVHLILLYLVTVTIFREVYTLRSFSSLDNFLRPPVASPKKQLIVNCLCKQVIQNAGLLNCVRILILPKSLLKSLIWKLFVKIIHFSN
jgi:hypothetical protein